MKKLTQVFTSCLLLLLSLTVLVSCSMAAQHNSWLRGIAAPDNAWGVDGDMYLDTDDGDLYNKVGGIWTKVGNLTGPAGEAGTEGQDGLGVKNVSVEDGNLIFTLTNGQIIDAGRVTGDLNYDITISDGALNVQTKKTYEDMDSIAFGNKTFRDIFEKGNILTTGNMLDSKSFGSWDTVNGTSTVSTEHFASKPSSLVVNGSRDFQNIKTLTSENKGNLYIASQVNVEKYTTGCFGAFARVAGTDVLDGMLDKATVGFKVASQIVNYDASSVQIVVGSSGNKSGVAYIDSIVVVNLSNVFGGETYPTKEDLDDLLNVYVKLFNGEKNVTCYRNYSSVPEIEEIPREEARDKFFDAVYRKAQQINLSIERGDIVSAIGLNNNKVTVEDLCKIGIFATGNEELQKIWNQNNYVTTTQGNVRSFSVDSAILNHQFIHELTDYYYILGNKGGMLNHKGELPVRTLILAVEGPDGSTIVLATSASHAGTPGRNRISNAKILVDIAYRRIKQGFDTDVSDLEANLSLDGAAVVVLPKSGHINNYNHYDWFGADSKYCVYKKNSGLHIQTASTWKTMTALTALDYITDLDQTVYVHKDDISSVASTPALEGGEIITFRDALYFMMLPSSNIAPNVIARGVGEILIRKGL